MAGHTVTLSEEFQLGMARSVSTDILRRVLEERDAAHRVIEPDHFPPSRHWRVDDRFTIPGRSGSYPDASRDVGGVVVGFHTSWYAKEHMTVLLDNETVPRDINTDVCRPDNIEEFHARHGVKST